MTVAKYTLKIDWDDDNVFTGTGEDVSSRLIQLEWQVGRDYASQLIGVSLAGRLIAILDNTSGDYSSYNTSSPLAGNLIPGHKVQLQGGSGSFPYTFPIVFNDKPQWTGFLIELEPLPKMDGRDLVKLEAWGPLGWLNEEDVELAMATSKATGTAIGDILDEVSWPAADRDIDVGQTTMDRFWLNEQKTLTGLRLVERTESGFLREKKDGVIRFEDRHARLKSPHTTSQATFSDTTGAARTYSRTRRPDNDASLFNRFPLDMQTYTVGASALLWTLAESGADSPLFAPGESKTVWARFPNPDSATDAFAVDAWTTLVENTDYEANTESGGGGTDKSSDFAIVETKLGNAMKMVVTYSGTPAAYLTLLQAQGTPILRNDPIRVEAFNAASQNTHGKRTYEPRDQFIPDSVEGQAWCDFNLSMYKDPIPIIEIVVTANISHSHLVEVLTRDISDRVTLVCNELGINEDFFIEFMKHTVRVDQLHRCTMRLSPASGYSGFWILDTSKLDTETVVAY